jgi:lipoprotein-releasing system permease protein
VLISVTAVLISFVATLYPAWQASRMLPAEALRYE